jgi:hypothetical protein
MKVPVATRLLVVVLALFAVGCTGKCRQLSEKACECSINTYVRDSCRRTVAANESNFPTKPSDEDYCATLLDKCDCRLLDTPEGKVNCGLAWPKDLPVTQ